jgi:hypothetical protein
VIVPVQNVAAFLDAHHYLGAARRGFAWSDEFGVLVLGSPSSRMLPGDWLELSRWCLIGIPNGGSQQWARVARWLRANNSCTTVVSYSDPSAGHSGALYQACNWLWAPTWQRLRPPPTGNGSWKSGVQQSVKDRWVFPLTADARRASVLSVKDEALVRRGCVGYVEPARFRRKEAAA